MASDREFTPRVTRVAETTIKRLGEIAGAVVNPVSDDQNGWDCIIEFDAVSSPLPKDLAPPGLMLLAQVKSSLAGAQTCQLTLSNALKFARHPLPCFVLLVSYENGPDNEVIYVRHVWDGLIKQILRRVREAEVEGRPLNKSEITVRLSDEDRHDAETLKHMARTLDAFGANYASKKQAIVDAAGYETGYAAGKLTFGEGMDAETLVDFMLGLIKSVPVQNFTLTDMRFGIPAPSPTIDGFSGVVELVPEPFETCTLTFLAPSGEISLKGEIFVPGLPNLPRDLWKVRVKTELLDVGVKIGGVSKFSATIETKIELPFETIRKAATIWSWTDEKPVDFQVLTRGRVAWSGTFKVDPNETSFWPTLHAVLEPLAALAPPDRRPADLAFKVQDFVAKLEDLEEFTGLIGDRTIDITFELDNGADVPSAKRFRCPFHIEIARFVFVALVERPVLAMSKVGEKSRFSLGQATVLRGAILEGTAEEHRDYIAAEMKALSEQEGEDVLTIVP